VLRKYAGTTVVGRSISMMGLASPRGDPPGGMSVENTGMEDEMQGEADRGDQKPLRKALRSFTSPGPSGPVSFAQGDGISGAC